MVCLSEVNLGELLPPPHRQLRKYVIDAREGVLFCLQLGIYCDLIVGPDKYCPIWFDNTYNRCRPAAEFDLV